MNGIIIGGVVLAGVACTYLLLKGMRKNYVKVIDLTNKSVEGELAFTDVKGWFQTIPDLNKETDTPFIANVREKEKIKQKMNFTLNFTAPEGKECLLVGVFNEKERAVTKAVTIEADSFDDQIKELLGTEAFVVLS